jgi:hypothetical protein
VDDADGPAAGRGRRFPSPADPGQDAGMAEPRRRSRDLSAEEGQGAPAEAPPLPLSRRDFEAALARLTERQEGSEENPGSVRCERCRACVSCMFCRDCEACHRCTHCARCQGSSHLTHCSDCTGCHDCAYCERSERCAGSSYLVLSRDCSDCTYCFGCVGLSKKDFHILNRPYGRAEYFRITEQLRRALGLEERRR